MFSVLVLMLLMNGEKPCRWQGLGRVHRRGGLLGKGLSPYQLFKAALDFLGMLNCLS